MQSADVYWIWVDITGHGKEWQLAVCQWNGDQFEDDEADLMVNFVHHDHQDYAENYGECPMILVEPPRETPSE